MTKRLSTAIPVLLAVVVMMACDSDPAVVPSGPSSIFEPSRATLSISAFTVSRDSKFLRADFTLKEIGGKSQAILSSIVFEEFFGGFDLAGASCWGNFGTITPTGTFDSRVLGSCQLAIKTDASGAAKITVIYRQTDGRLDRVVANIGPDFVGEGPH